VHDDRIDIDHLVTLVQRQAEQLDVQAARIDELERRLEGPPPPESRQPPIDPTEPARPDRRSLLRGAGLATAGALGGAAVLAQASPAMAAQGTFDGNPAVLGTANPTTGLGVRGETLTGIGVQGRSQAVAGPAIGVEGLVAGTASTAVKGTATATTSATIGVQGTVASPDGIGVVAANSATTGTPVGMKSTAAAVDGVAILGDATSTAVAAVNEDAVGVKGIARSTRGTGVFGEATNTAGATAGVKAQTNSPDGFAVNAFCAATGVGAGVGAAMRAATNSNGGTAVRAVCNSASGTTKAVHASVNGASQGTAVLAEGALTGVRAIADGATGSAIEIGVGRTSLRFTNPNPPPLTAITPRTYAVGDIVYDTAGDLWICTVAGTPGSFRRLGGATTAGALVLLNTPVRVNDSRPGEVPLNSTKGPITGNTTRVIDMKNNSSGVPVGASGVLCTLTIVNTSANGGFLSLFKNGAATPTTSTVNWFAANQVVATTTVTAVDATAQAKLFCPANSSTNYFIDVIGFYQ